MERTVLPSKFAMLIHPYGNLYGECSEEDHMSKETKRRLSRRDFIKAVTAFIGGTIGTLMGVPVIGYLLAPALRKEGHQYHFIGPFGKWVESQPTRFYRNKSERLGTHATVVGMYVLRKEVDPYGCFPTYVSPELPRDLASDIQNM
jgi:hypothetical protein